MNTITPSHLAAGRAVDQLRRQLGIIFQCDNGKRLGALPIEGAMEDMLPAWRTSAKTRISLLITAARAQSIGFNASGGQGVRVDAQSLSFAQLLALADPLADQQSLPRVTPQPATPSQDMLLTLARYASLLPALLVIEGDHFPDDWLRVSEADVRAYWASPPLDMVALAAAALPIEGAEDAKITCFRQRYGTSVHLALTMGETGDDVLTRIHSSCLTGDILGSLRCDCGDQLTLALQAIRKEGAGILIYLHQEGRGIGIANKLRAYQLQERGVDTYNANRMLGFEDDERDFSVAAAILKKLGVRKIRLLTNNPHKMAAIEKAGIKVTGRVPLVAPPGKHNHDYLATKGKAGHLF